MPRAARRTASARNRRKAGTITDVWVDRSDRILRYYQVRTNGSRDVLAPVGFSNVNRRRGVVEIESINAAQFEDVPTLETAGQITRLEEDKIMGYFGGGYLYGLPGRTEPFL